MADELARINLLTDLRANIEASTEDGTPGIATDYSHRLGWLSGGSFRWGAMRDTDERFASVTVSNAVSGLLKTDGLKKIVSSDIFSEVAGLGYASNLSVSDLTSGFYPLAGTSGRLANGSLSEDAASVKSAKPLTLNGATRPEWSLWDAPIQLSSLAAIYTITGTGGQVGFARNFYINSIGEKIAIVSGTGVGYPSQFHVDDNGRLRFYASQTNPVAGSPVTDVNLRLEVNRFGGLGLYGVSAPTSRPTISGQRTATATLAALYQALGATGLILDATTETSVTREAIIQPLPITNSAPGVVTVVSGGMKSFGFDGNTVTEELFYHCDVQHDYIAGGDLLFHVHWMPATASGGDAKSHIEYQWVEAGATWPAPSTLTGTTAAGATAWADKRTDFTIPGTGHTYNSRLMVRLFRNPVDAADTYTGDAVLSSVGMHYQADPGQP